MATQMPRLENPNTFANNPLDRVADKRTDPDWVGERLADPSSLILPLWQLKTFVIDREDGGLDVGWLRPGLLGNLADDDPTTVLLGVENDIAHFAMDVSALDDPDGAGPLAQLGRFMDVREIAGTVHTVDAAILAQARSLIGWHQRHGYCANCGSPTVMEEAGYRRACHNCSASHFPRTDPVVIVLVTDGDRALLGRSPKFPPGFYSSLAGFIEPGETIEEAAKREVFEESGIRIKNVRYHASQPWPYPSSLMIGCFAEAETREIKVDGVEIEDAQWYPLTEVRSALRGENDSFRVPPPVAIAHQLLKTWVFGP